MSNDVAAQFAFNPKVSAGIARTDNLTLDADRPQSETVYEVLPEFNISQNSPRLTSTAVYRVEAYRYDTRRDTDLHHRLDGQMRAALEPDNFFFDVAASRRQSIRDPLEPIPRSNLPITSNLIDRDEVSAGPVFQYGAGNVAFEGSFKRSWIRYEDDGDELGNAHSADQTSFSVNNYRKQRGLAWATTYESHKVDYDLLLPYEYRRAGVELGAWVRQGVRVFASGGKESAWDEPFDPSLADRYWEVGFSGESGERFSAEVAVGERTFGRSGRTRVAFAFGRAAMSLRYEQRPTTEALNPYNRGGLLQPDTPDDFLAQPGSPERFISKRAEWSLGVHPRRSALTVTLFDEIRDERTLIDGTPLADEAQSGGYVTASMDFGPKTTAALSLQSITREFSATQETRLTASSFTVSRRPSPRTTLSFVYSQSREEFAASYDAHMLTFLFTRTL